MRVFILESFGNLYEMSRVRLEVNSYEQMYSGRQELTNMNENETGNEYLEKVFILIYKFF